MEETPITMPALPGQPCETPPRSEWTKPEKWVWRQVCEGKTANFNGLHGELDPGDPDGWSHRRLISPQFLETILVYDPFRSALPREGVRIIGAWVKGQIDLAHGRLACPWWLAKSRFDADVQLSSLQSTDAISFEGSVFTGRLGLYGAKVGELRMSGAKCLGTLNMNSLEVGDHLFMSNGAEFADVVLRGAKISGLLDMISAKCSGTLDMDSLEVGGSLFMSNGAEFADVVLVSAKISGLLDMISAKCSGTLNMSSLEVGGLFMRNGAEFADVDLHGAKVGGQLDMSDAKCSGTLNMDSLEVGSSLLMRNGAEFADVVLRGAKISGQLDMSDAKCSGTLNMDSLEVGGHLLMSNGAEFADVDLVSAKVGGQLAMSSAKCSGTLDMDSLEVGGSLFMRATEFGKAITLVFAEIGSTLDLSGATLSSLDMTGSRVRDELRLGSGRHPKPVWGKESQLILRNAVVGAVQDRSEQGAWPQRLDLDGFTYTQLGGLYGEESGSDIAAREATWFIEWLEKDQTYTPQPYHQLANVLRATGHPKKANDILYAGKERERLEAVGLKWWGLSLLKSTIGYGYGYRYFFSLRWVVTITLIGAAVLATTERGQPSSVAEMLAFSFDLLLPIIELHESHKITFEGWQRYYFYGHKLMGFVLGSFVVAGLSGITKK